MWTPEKFRHWLLPLMAISYFALTASLLPPAIYFEQASDGIIVDSLRAASHQSEPSLFMYRIVPQWSSEALPYYSQFGLTYRVFLPIRQLLPYPILHFLLSLIYALATGAVFWWFHRMLSREHGDRSGIFFLILCCASPAFLMFSGSFYWQLPLLVAPFFAAYILAPARPSAATLLVFLLLLLRFLGGYEYTSSLILSPVAAIAVRCAFGEITLSRGARIGLLLVVAGTASFATAISAHLGALSSATGSWREGLAQFEHVVNYRTVGDSIGREVTLRNDMISLICSFFRNESLLVAGLGAITLCLLFFSRGRHAALRMAAALLFAFICSLSWQVLARGHMRDHNHINFIVYLIPFGLSVYLAFSRVAGDLVKSRFVEIGNTSARAGTNRQMERM